MRAKGEGCVDVRKEHVFGCLFLVAEYADVCGCMRMDLEKRVLMMHFVLWSMCLLLQWMVFWDIWWRGCVCVCVCVSDNASPCLRGSGML